MPTNLACCGLQQLLADYLLRNDLRTSSAEFYSRTVAVFRSWYGGDVPSEALTAELVNAFLADKQKLGRSGHYRASLKAGLRAILGERIDRRRLRRIRTEPLEPQFWTASEVAKLIAACQCLPSKHREYFRQIIAVAYHTGLSLIDLHQLHRHRHIDGDGLVRIRRSKTGAEAVAKIPADLLASLPRQGLVFPRRFTGEMFRRYFRQCVQEAGLCGSFKTLRSSSGTVAELQTGRGHEHLANTRRVFERHYLVKERIARKPVEIDLPPTPPAVA